jgi:hypothetical protein
VVNCADLWGDAEFWLAGAAPVSFSVLAAKLESEMISRDLRLQ